MKRFFSIAVSVGFAAQIIKFPFLSDITLMDSGQIHHFVWLIFSMIIVIGSAEYYFFAIDVYPLKDNVRFYIDLAIVTLYMLLLASSDGDSNRNYLLYFCIIMGMYILWDFATIQAYPKMFAQSDFDFKNTIAFYRNGMTNCHPAHPSIALYWAVVVLVISLIRLWVYDIYLLPAASIVAYICFRLDQTKGWRLGTRLGISFILLALVGTIVPQLPPPPS